MSYDAIRYLFVQVCECVFVWSFESVWVTVVGQGAVVGVKDCFVHAKMQCFLWIWRKSRYHHKQPVYGDTCKLASILVRPPYHRTVSPWSHRCSFFLFFPFLICLFFLLCSLSVHPWLFFFFFSSKSFFRDFLFSPCVMWHDYRQGWAPSPQNVFTHQNQCSFALSYTSRTLSIYLVAQVYQSHYPQCTSTL